jgi:hypothetical protein
MHRLIEVDDLARLKITYQNSGREISTEVVPRR